MFAVYFSAIVVSVLTAIYVLLVKQIEIMNLDTTSFQSLYMADSAFECALYKEQNASSSNSVFLPQNSTNLGYCGTAGDAKFLSDPVSTAGRSDSILRVRLLTDYGDFCAIVKIGKQTDNSEVSNSMNISGQSRTCPETLNDLNNSTEKVVERSIDFSY